MPMNDRALPDEWEALGDIEASYRAEGPNTVRVSISGDAREYSPSDGEIAQALSQVHGGDDWGPADGAFNDGNWSSADGEPDVTRLFRRHDAQLPKEVTPMSNVTVITESDIRQLSAEAGQAGDQAMVAICDRALRPCPPQCQECTGDCSQDAAWQECERVIRDARAQVEAPS